MPDAAPEAAPTFARSSKDMAYEHKDIEKKWREEWRKRGTYRVENDTSKPKYYLSLIHI